jgi:cytochrome c-type biogenesis protein CcmH
MSPTLAFWTGAIGLALMAWLLLVLPASRHTPAERQPLNIRLRREQVAALRQELAIGRITPEEHGQATLELERAVLEESDAAARSAVTAQASRPIPNTSRRLAIALAFGIAFGAFGLYGFLGDLAGLDAAAPAQVAEAARVVKPSVSADTASSTASTGDPSAAAVEAMLDSMTASMSRQREGTVDAAGWTLIARSYAALQRFDSASRAYASALALAPNDAQLLADHADVLSVLQDKRMDGEPIRLVRRALQIDPDNPKALALAGTDAFERRDFASAKELWTRARRVSAPGEFTQTIDRNLAAVQEALVRSPASAVESTASAAGPARFDLRGRLRIADEMAARVAPTDTVFVFAREVGAVGMPIALARYLASDLPVDFALDGNSAMVDRTRLAGISRVEIGARISRSGDATPRAGDPRGKSAPVAIDRQDLLITIDDVTP